MVAEIRDRAVSAGYDLVECVALEGDESRCSDDVMVSDGASLFINLYGGGAPVIDEAKLLDIVGMLDGCAPDCEVEESSFDR